MGQAESIAAASATGSPPEAAAAPATAAASAGSPAAPLAEAAAALSAALQSDSPLVPPAVELKMVLVVNGSLEMSKGKTAAQVAHAAVACWLDACSGGGVRPMWVEWARAWQARACAKITLKCEGMAELEAIAEAAQRAGLPCSLIEDAGRTEIAAGSRTVCGIGPAPRELIDAITGPKGAFKLRLLA